MREALGRFNEQRPPETPGGPLAAVAAGGTPATAAAAAGDRRDPSLDARIAERLNRTRPASEPEQESSVTPPPVGAILGALDVAQAKGRWQAERERQRLDAQHQADVIARAREAVRLELGEWTREARARADALQPNADHEHRAVRQLGRTVWVMSRLASAGSLNDLAYAVQHMALTMPAEAFGCMVIEAMGLAADGVAVRQLYSTKARRKLVRSYVQWSAGQYTRLREIAGSPSRRIVRGLKRVPQTLLAKLCAVGDRPWSRATTTRDAAESHRAGLWRRVRLPHDLAHASEQCGPSGQVVSRYWMETPRMMRRKGDRTATLGGVLGRTNAQRQAVHDWAREVAANAIVYAKHAIALVRGGLIQLAYVPELLDPVRSPPTA